MQGTGKVLELRLECCGSQSTGACTPVLVGPRGPRQVEGTQMPWGSGEHSQDSLGFAGGLRWPQCPESIFLCISRPSTFLAPERRPPPFS